MTCMRLILSAAVIVLSACQGDETVSAYGAAGKTWVLREIDNAPFSARATLAFPEPGQISGQGPCNGFSANLRVPYPWFDAENLVSTKTACPDLAQETRYFQSLDDMSLIEVLGDVMLLSNDAGRQMVFKAGD